MKRHIPLVLTTLAAALVVLSSCVSADQPPAPSHLIAHDVKLDNAGKLLAWTGYDDVIARAWNQLARFPTEANGLPSFFSYPRFEGGPGASLKGLWWAYNPAGLTAMLIDGSVARYAYDGDENGLRIARALADHQLAHGTTPDGWSWAQIPYASANPGQTEWSGGDDRLFCGDQGACGRGDGVGFIEPDKIGELGFGYLQLFEHYGDEQYAAAAVHCADALAAHVASGDKTHSPWPFRVDAETGLKVREPYGSNVIGPIKLFDELLRLKRGDTAAYSKARTTAWSWLMKYPMKNHLWQGYFEDIPIHVRPGENPNQYSPVETVKYLIQHPELDPKWEAHARDQLAWVTKTFTVDFNGRFGLEAGHQWGAEVLSEQIDDMAKMSSHTARFGSALALLARATGDAQARERARLSLDWATYACDDNGVVKVGTNDDEGYWFSDGYGDYMRHFQLAMAAVPEWAPAGQNHLLESTSVVRKIRYEGGTIELETFDADATETFKLEQAPWQVIAGDHALAQTGKLATAEAFAIEKLADGSVLLRVHHTGSNKVTVLGIR